MVTKKLQMQFQMKGFHADFSHAEPFATMCIFRINQHITFRMWIITNFLFTFYHAFYCTTPKQSSQLLGANRAKSVI